MKTFDYQVMHLGFILMETGNSGSFSVGINTKSMMLGSLERELDRSCQHSVSTERKESETRKIHGIPSCPSFQAIPCRQVLLLFCCYE